MMFKATIFLLSVAATLVLSEMVQPPLRLRVNTDLIQRVFHKKDQDLLLLLTDLHIGDVADVKDLTVSLEPASGDIEKFDVDLVLSEPPLLGLEGRGLVVKGRGKSGETEVTVEGKVRKFRGMIEKTDEEGIKVNLKEFVFEMDPATTVVTPAGVPVEDLIAAIQTGVVRELERMKDEIMKGSPDLLTKLPIMSLAPLAALFYGAYGAEKV